MFFIYALIALGAWFTVAGAVALLIGRAIKIADRKQREQRLYRASI